MNERDRVATRGGWRRWCLLLTATAAATLLGAGVSQAQTTITVCFTSDPSETCLVLPVRGEASTPPTTYPNPLVAYYSITGGLTAHTPNYPSVAYNSTTGTVGWYGTALPTTWTGTAPAQVLQKAQTSTLGVAAGTKQPAVTVCPPDPSTNTPMTVSGLKRHANMFYLTMGIELICTSADRQVTRTGWNIVGASSAVTQTTECAAPAVGFGFSVRAEPSPQTGQLINAVSLECAVTGSHSASPMVGRNGGAVQGPALCPKGHALTGLQGTVDNSYLNTVNVVGVTGICTQYASNSGLGAAGGGVLAYKGTSPKGAVKFSVATKKGTALGAGKPGWDYTLGGFRFATGCSRASAKVPGKVAVFGRESAGKPTSFSLTSGRFSVTGKLSGKLSKPKVTGRLKILEGACKGKTLRFTATASR